MLRSFDISIAWYLFQGAICGLLVGLTLSLWIGFGQPKPPAEVKYRSTEGCQSTTSNLSLAAQQFTSPTTTKITTLLGTLAEEYSNSKNNKSSNSCIGCDGVIDTAHSPPVQPDDDNSSSESNFLHQLYAVSYAWIGLIGFTSCCLVGLLVSGCTGMVDSPLSVSRALLFCGEGVDGELRAGTEQIHLANVSIAGDGSSSVVKL